MTQSAKLLQKLTNSGSDNNWTIGELTKALALKGYTLRNIAGSHHNFYGKGIIFTVPAHGNGVKPIYIKKARALP